MQPTCQRFAIAAILFGVSGGVIAGTPALSRATATATATASLGAAAQAQRPGYVADLGRSLDPTVLAQLSGGTDIRNGITLNGNVSDTSTDHTVSGGNAIGSGAFSNAVGLPMVIQNSGNSVLIQNATIVNVQLQP